MISANSAVTVTLLSGMVKVYLPLPLYGDVNLLERSRDMVSSLEKSISVTDEESEIYAINHASAGSLSDKPAELIEEALKMCRRMDGALDISIYPIVRAWGFTTGNYQVPSEDTIQSMLSLVNYTKIWHDAAAGTVTLPAGMEIDLGSVAKGYAGRMVAQMLRDNGVESALLNLGGNVQTIGSRPDGSPWKIGIKAPWGQDAMMVISVRDQAVVTSGGYERYFEQDGQIYWHIMSPATGHPSDSGLISVTVVGDDGIVCDGLSTALFVMGLQKAADFWAQSNDFEAVFVTASGEVYITEGLKDCFVLTEGGKGTPVNVIER